MKNKHSFRLQKSTITQSACTVYPDIKYFELKPDITTILLLLAILSENDFIVSSGIINPILNNASFELEYGCIPALT